MARRPVGPVPPEIRAAEAAIEPRTVPPRAVRPAAAVQSDAPVASRGLRRRVDLAAAVELVKAARPVGAAAFHAAATVAVVPDALVVAAVLVAAVVEPAARVVAPVRAVREAAAPDAAARAAVADALVAAAVLAAVAVEPDARVVAPVRAVAGSVAAETFSPSRFVDLLEGLGRSQARPRAVRRALMSAPGSTEPCRPAAPALFWTSLPIFRCKNFRFKVVADESVSTGAKDLSLRRDRQYQPPCAAQRLLYPESRHRSMQS